MFLTSFGQRRTGYFLLGVLLVNFILVSDFVRPAKGDYDIDDLLGVGSRIKKRRLIRKLKKILPFLLAIKPRKKLMLLPIPVPFP